MTYRVIINPELPAGINEVRRYEFDRLTVERRRATSIHPREIERMAKRNAEIAGCTQVSADEVLGHFLKVIPSGAPLMAWCRRNGLSYCSVLRMRSGERKVGEQCATLLGYRVVTGKGKGGIIEYWKPSFPSGSTGHALDHGSGEQC